MQLLMSLGFSVPLHWWDSLASLLANLQRHPGFHATQGLAAPDALHLSLLVSSRAVILADGNLKCFITILRVQVFFISVFSKF